MGHINTTEGPQFSVRLTTRDQDRLHALAARLKLSAPATMRLALRELAREVLRDASGVHPLAARLAALEGEQAEGSL